VDAKNGAKKDSKFVTKLDSTYGAKLDA